MLSSLLDSIKGQFTSKSYWLGSMFPLLLFLFANGVLVRIHSPKLTQWLTAAENLQNAAFQYSAIVAVLLALAFILSLTSALMLQFLEGQHLGFFRPLFFRVQWGRREQLEERSTAAWKVRNELEDFERDWTVMLRNARLAGRGKESLSRLPAGQVKDDMRKVRRLMRFGGVLEPAFLSSAATGLASLLANNDAGKNIKGPLHEAHTDFLTAMKYALDRAEYDRIRILNELQFHFPGERKSAPEQIEGASPNRILAPTRMGNIGRTMQAYALSRYGMDLDIFWTRLQSALQKDGTAYFGSLQDAKAQLDCCVTLVWLSAAFTGLWAALLLLFYGNSTQAEFWWVTASGTVATTLSYLLACQTYRTFADVVRSCVDLFRLKVLDSLSMPQPYGTEEERGLWERLGESIGHGAREEFKFKSS